MERKGPKQPFFRQRQNARTRGIEWSLTFEEWQQIWVASGQLLNRGRKKGQYVMARFGDKGPYSISNVEIIQNGDNTRAAHTGRKRSTQTKERIRIANTGKKCSDETKAKLSSLFAGRNISADTRAKMSAAKIGVPVLDEHRQAIAKANRTAAKREQSRRGALARWARSKTDGKDIQ